MGLMDVYNMLPAFAQNIAFSAAGAKIQRTRYGVGFHKMLDEFESHANWSKDQLVSWRDERLRDLVQHAYNTVPYYRETMDEGGINPMSIRSGEDLARFPLLTKDMVKANPEKFISSEIGKMNVLHVHTSGTTGSGFQFDSTFECQQAQFACFWRYYHQHGLTQDTWQAQFSSRNAVPKRTNKPPFWRIDKPGRRYYMSAFHESSANLKSYYDIIMEKRFRWISGYPSLMSLLAQWMNERDLCFDFVEVVTCGAENLLDYQADAMERAFGVRPVQTYGQTENVAIFSQQPDGRILVDEDFSVVEFVSNNSGGFSDCWNVLVQLCDTSHTILHKGYRDGCGLDGFPQGGSLFGRKERGLPLSARWDESWQARPSVQGHPSLSGGTDLSEGRLLGCVSSRGRAVHVRRRRNEGAKGVSRFCWRIHRNGVRVPSPTGKKRVSEASLRRIGCRAA